MRSLGEFMSGTMTEASEHTSKISSEQANRLTYKLVRVERDGSFVPASDDEVTEVEHLLAEPRNEKGLVDGVLNFDLQNTQKCFSSEGFPCPVDYSQLKADNATEALDCGTTQEEREDIKYEFLDGILQGVDEEDLHIANGLSSACDDYLLDYAPCEGSHLGNPSLDNHSPDSNKRGRGAAEISKSSTPTGSVSESASDQNALLLDEMTIRELQEAFRSTFGRETSVKDKQWLKRRISLGLQNLVDLDTVSCVLDSGTTSNENEGDKNFKSRDDSPGRMYRAFKNVLGDRNITIGQGLEKGRFVCRDVSTTSSFGTNNVGRGPLNSGDRKGETQKRLRRPTRRYIEESSDLKSRSCSGRLEVPITNSGDKLIRARSDNRHHRKRFGASPAVYREDTLKGSSIQVPFALHVRRGRPKKNASILGHDSKDNKNDLGPSPSVSQEDLSDDSTTTARSEKGASRRKHHRLWSLSEVMKLIDGVSQYGVGRWTEIKRLLFSASSHRTSVDLKDKWRNLLRASGAQLHGKREVEQGRKHATRPIPPPVLRRVSELAIIYPYPRERKSKLARPGPVSTTPIPPTACSDPSVSRRGRILRRKSLS